MPGSSLGYHSQVNSARRSDAPPVRVSVPPPPAPVKKSRRERAYDVATTFGSGAGFLPMLLFAGVFLTIPLLHFYVAVDYTDGEKAGIVAIAAVAAVLPAIAQDPVAWYNMVLFFHIGVEARLLDVTYDFAVKDGIPDEEMVMAWIGFATVIAHLLPFLLLDGAVLLCSLAVVGVVVNTALAVYIDTSLLVVVFISSIALLQMSLCVLSCGNKASLLYSFVRAVKTGKWIGCCKC